MTCTGMKNNPETLKPEVCPDRFPVDERRRASSSVAATFLSCWGKDHLFLGLADMLMYQDVINLS